MISILFAAGQGSRLKPITDTTPKPLISVAGKTLIEYNLEKIAPYSQAIVIVVNYLKEEIINSVGSSYYFEGKKIPILYAIQKSSKGGTMQAFRCGLEEAEKYLDQQNSDQSGSNEEKSHGFLALNSDDIHGGVFAEIAQSIQSNPETALITGIRFEDREALKNFGVLKLKNSENPEHGNQNSSLFLESIVEKPQSFVSDIINTGIYYFPNQISSFIKNIEPIAEGEEYITRDLIGKYILNKDMRVIIEDLWVPVNNHSELEKAEKLLGNSQK